MRRMLRVPLLALPVVMLLASCAGDGDESPDVAATTGNPVVTTATDGTAGAAAGGTGATEAAGYTAVVDVRTPDEYAAGHVAGALNIDVQSADFAAAIADLDAGGTYLVYCRSGNRSAQASALMVQAGLDVVDGGGLADMEAAGYDVTAS